MKTTILTFILALVALVGMGQSKKGKLNNMEWAGTLEIKPSIFTYTQADSAQEIFTFRMTSDRKRLMPVDTEYYTMSNQMYQQITYVYKRGQNWAGLIVRNYNDGHNWLFWGFSLIDDIEYLKKQKTLILK